MLKLASLVATLPGAESKYPLIVDRGIRAAKSRGIRVLPRRGGECGRASGFGRDVGAEDGREGDCVDRLEDAACCARAESQTSSGGCRIV